MSNGVTIDVSRRKKEEFIRMMGLWVWIRRSSVSDLKKSKFISDVRVSMTSNK
jgi:hypothetical protein